MVWAITTANACRGDTRVARAGGKQVAAWKRTSHEEYRGGLAAGDAGVAPTQLSASDLTSRGIWKFADMNLGGA